MKKTRTEEILKLKAKGLGATEIAKRLGISRRTVYSHLNKAKKVSEKITEKISLKSLDKKLDEILKILKEIKGGEL
jgi:DNA invertase Pin-like site-specific DNA recombinase